MKRMEQRGISEQEIRKVLEQPQWTTPGEDVPSRGPRVHYWGRVDGRLIRVTVAVDDHLVVSVVAPEEEQD